MEGGNKGRPKKFTCLFVAKRAATDPITVVWGDGDEREVPDLTVVEHQWRGRQAARGRAQPVWAGSTVAGEARAVVHRQDRAKLVVLQEGGRQVLQINEKQHRGQPTLA